MRKQPKLVDQLKAAKRVSVPLVAIQTPDPAATIQAAMAAMNGPTLHLAWDVATGLVALTDNAAPIAATLNDEPLQGNPVGMLLAAKKLPEKSILYIHLANRWASDPSWVQACWNLRDAFKADFRMLVLLAPAITLPAELAGDVLVLDEPLPDTEQLRQIVTETVESAELDIGAEPESLAVEAVQGLPAFAAEQAVAMSLSKDGVDLGGLWERKRQQIEQTPGLKVYREGERFDDIGGCENIKGFLRRLVSGQARPNAVIFVDEIEKAMGGAKGDTSGVSQDQLGALLSYMQDHAADGTILIGPPGAAKSAIAKATGNEAGVPTVQLDLGAAKGSLVGQSEQQLRQALKVVTSVSNGRSLWIATCNSIADLPPELRRRFTLGTYFFDLPTAEERALIWGIYQQKYSVGADDPLPSDSDWTGAEIKTCCRMASMLGVSLAAAAQYIVPVARSAPDQLERLRAQADGRFLSASYAGVYRRQREEGTNGVAAPKRRKLSVQ